MAGGGGFSNPDQLGLVRWDNDDAGLAVPMWSVGLFVGATFNSTRLSFHVRTQIKGKSPSASRRGDLITFSSSQSDSSQLSSLLIPHPFKSILRKHLSSSLPFKDQRGKDGSTSGSSSIGPGYEAIASK